MPIRDWAQVPNEDLKVHTSNSEGTKQAKEAEKGRREAIWKERQAEACWQRAEEACLEREHQEHEEQEKRDREEHEERKKAPADPSVQHDDQGPNQDDGGSPHIRGKAAMQWVPTTKREDNEGTAGGSRKHAGTGGSQGSRKKKGQTSNEDDNNNKIEEGCIKTRAIITILSPSLGFCFFFSSSGQGVLERLYDEQMLMVQGRQVAVMEQMAAVMELQALAVQAYMRHMTAPPLWPPVGQVGAVAGGVEMGTRGSQLGVEWSESEVAEEPEESGSEGIKDVEGEEDMQE
ncbi:hypothetical protein EDD17DRAFT_1760276 [Pisolithus thermaeus]|nr:hypothetical protein EDD17DRAFT_1760276 [Pisolithus thermaeus]